MPRCGTSAFRRVQLLVFKVVGKSGGWSLTVHKNERSGLVESLMRPTKRVARLRATNNSYLYSFPLSSSFLTRSSPLFSICWYSCLFVFVVFPSSHSLFASFVRRSNSNSCRKKPGNLPRPNAFTFEVFGSGPKSVAYCRPIMSDPYLPSPSLNSWWLSLLCNYNLYFSTYRNNLSRW